MFQSYILHFCCFGHDVGIMPYGVGMVTMQGRLHYVGVAARVGIVFY